nr:immunoglobulin light chain junction region [Macaca mulatta]MOX51427.1 immunoglobulin light chain junction region [Macaca mulatta]MOX51429.1 immunoglobulin light chain junction region [Macaca mulatta]MOX51435.1 immunoglobulin light chain junction region [Macaca mulatta]MOX51457.1 immunoglobulin light chain junction region [Macaca mulatta]
CHQYNNWITF